MYRRAGRGRLLLVVFLALSIAVITLDFRANGTGPLERAKDISSTIVAPIQRGITTVFRPVGNFFSSLGDLSNLRTENARLKDENAQLNSQISRARTLEAENLHLKELMNLDKPWTAMKHVPAEVIATVPSNYKWAVVIDKGSADGIKADMPVVDVTGLVGHIVHVEAHASTLLMLIDPQSGAAAKIQGSGHLGLLRGNGGGQPLSLQLIKTTASVNVGDTVVTSTYSGGIYPPDIPIGVVTSSGGDPRAAQQTINVAPYVDFNSIDYLQVLLTHQPPAQTSKKAGKHK
jgi:rod shape-determining protein MreC